jgi:Phosphoserine phosphatase RsbU, N-terminal domain
MSAVRAKFRTSYIAALRSHLDEPSETTLRSAYELGREAVESELSMLDLGAVHHDALRAALVSDRKPAGAEQVVRAAADFYLESLAASEMVQRGFREAHEAAQLERRQAALLRQLSNLLADASLAFDTSGSLEEMFHLVAEQARELTGAKRCRVRVTLVGRPSPLEVTSDSDSDEQTTAPTSAAPLVISLATLDGREFGSIEVADRENGDFRDVDEAVLVHVAQMASAAFERAQRYAL